MKLEQCITGAVKYLPEKTYKKLREMLVRRNRQWLVGRCDLARCESGRLIKENAFTKVCVIRKGLYEYQYFNVCFLNNMLSLMIECCAEGMLPRVEIRNDKGDNIWEAFFRQPFEDVNTDGMQRIECEWECGKSFPAFDEIFEKANILKWGSVYKLFMHLNDAAQSYINGEINEIITGKEKILGVLCRGTDYVATKPQGHPVQPDLCDVVDKARELMSRKGYQKIYLATEDGKIDKYFREEFPDKIYINKRRYYDEIFDGKELKLIKDVHFERENDDYLKGMEYISSMMILSQCAGIVAGNCGGSQTAVFLNQGNYQDTVIYDLGLYGEC